MFSIVSERIATVQYYLAIVQTVDWGASFGDLVKQVRTPPVRPADGVVGCVYESFVPGVWHRWLEKEILWFCFRRAEPERMISGWTASSRDSSKTEEGKAPRGYGQIRSELRMSSKLKLSRILPL